MANHIPCPTKLMFHPLQSCAMQEIHGLSLYEGKAVEAMMEFCRGVFTKPIKFFTETVNSGALYSFYLFSEAIYTGRKGYGTGFAELIRANSLGTLWESPAMKNQTFHPDHANRMWVWMPDTAALKKWFDKQGGHKRA